MHQGRPGAADFARFVAGDFFVHPRQPGIPDRILQNPDDVGDCRGDREDGSRNITNHPCDHKLVRLIHDLDREHFRNQRKAEAERILPIRAIDELFALYRH